MLSLSEWTHLFLQLTLTLHSAFLENDYIWVCNIFTVLRTRCLQSDLRRTQLFMKKKWMYLFFQITAQVV